MSNLDFETDLWNKNYNYICGIDEVGRGCSAGPVYSGAVILDKNKSFEDPFFEKINDSIFDAPTHPVRENPNSPFKRAVRSPSPPPPVDAPLLRGNIHSYPGLLPGKESDVSREKGGIDPGEIPPISAWCPRLAT